MIQRLFMAVTAFTVIAGAAPQGGYQGPHRAGVRLNSGRASDLRQAPSAREIIAGSRAAFYAAAEDMRARVQMALISEDGRTRQRELTMLRKNFPGGEQRYYMYFHQPPDVRGTAFLVRAYPERADERWIYIPAINLVRRIAADDARSSFVGSDFSYEDVSGRDVDADEHRLLREDTVQGRAAYVIESQPVRPADYTRRVSWIDEATGLPLREEYYDVQGELARVFASDETREVEAGGTAIPTVVKRSMENVKTGHRTEVVFSEIEYDVGIQDDLFTEMSLRRPPRRWIR